MEQLFHIPNMLLIHKEQNHMVTRRDHCVVVGNDHLFVTDDCADGGARRQANVLNGLADDLTRLLITVGNRLDGFRRAPAQ